MLKEVIMYIHIDYIRVYRLYTCMCIHIAEFSLLVGVVFVLKKEEYEQRPLISLKCQRKVYLIPNLSFQNMFCFGPTHTHIYTLLAS